MTDTPIVRLATPADEPGIMNLCRLMHAENGLFTLSETKVRDRFQRAFTHAGGVIGVIDGERELRAAVMLDLGQLWYTDDWHVADLMVFVHPDHRKSDCVDALISFARVTADGIGLPMLSGVFSNVRTKAKVRLYQRLLGEPAGALFVYCGKAATVADPVPDSIWKGARTTTRGGKRARRRRDRALISDKQGHAP